MSNIDELTEILKRYKGYEFYLLTNRTEEKDGRYTDNLSLTSNGTNKPKKFSQTIDYTLDNGLKFAETQEQVVNSYQEVFQQLKKMERKHPLICGGLKYFNDFLISSQLNDIYCTNEKYPGFLVIGDIRTR